MKLKACITIALVSVLSCATAQYDSRTILFDNDWLFYRGGALGAEQPAFDDTKWRKLDLPHDWSIEDIPGTQSPFQQSAITQVAGGFTTGGTGWYRKSFTIPADKKDKRVYIQFDGVYMNAEVWLNGKRLGKHPYGYTSFWFDISNKLKYDSVNILAVKVANEGENSRWYAGSGIYRHVWLKTMEPVHIGVWATAVTTPVVNEEAATVHVKTKVFNDTKQVVDAMLVTRMLNAKGIEVAKITSSQRIAADTVFEFSQDMTVHHPELWSTENPALYKTISSVYVNTKLTDEEQTVTGIRYFSFDAVTGFRLNGRPLKLKGGCVHHDNGPLGAKAYDRAEERRVALLKESGFNAIRCAHNPPSPAFLDACDRLGMLVIDEAFDTWASGKNPSDYHLYFKEWWQKDIESMVYRDRNHPSIIMWSIGNEIPNRERPEVADMANKLSDYVNTLDSTRPVTAAVNGVEENKDLFFAALDVAGYNYAPDKYIPDHTRKPGRVIMGTESFPLEAFDYWMGVQDHSWVIGDFVWTSFDYLGEASIGWRGFPQTHNFYPWNNAFCGDLDICGWKRPQSYYRDVLWRPAQLSLFVKPPTPSFPVNTHKESWSKWNWDDVAADWNWKGYENKPLEVNVYSSCEEAELFLNDRSLGKKRTNRSSKFIAAWQVPYQPGVLKAVGYNNGRQVNTAILRSAADPVQLKLTADRTAIQSNGQDLSYITIELEDASGVCNPKAENLVQFTLQGPGAIAAVGNANPVSIESCEQPQRKAWHGRCLVIVKAGKQAGKITLTASAKGLKPASIVIAAN